MRQVIIDIIQSLHSLSDVLPAKLWLLSGCIFIIGGGIVFYLGVIEKNQKKSRKMIKRSVFGMLVGCVAVLIPNFPWLALILFIIMITIASSGWALILIIIMISIASLEVRRIFYL